MTDIELHDVLPRRRTPPEEQPDGSTRITVQRCCNGCFEPLGDVTMIEIQLAIDGMPLPDVRMECPRCRPLLDPPLSAPEKPRDYGALRELLGSGPVVTGTTHPGYTVEPAVARKAAITVAELAPDDIPVLLDMIGITGKDGPGDGRWAVYQFGRSTPRKTKAGSE